MRRRLREIRAELEQMAEKESKRMYRLAWRSYDHGCKEETVDSIISEARWLHEIATAHPDRLIRWKFEWEFKYAFR